MGAGQWPGMEEPESAIINSHLQAPYFKRSCSTPGCPGTLVENHCCTLFVNVMHSSSQSTPGPGSFERMFSLFSSVFAFTRIMPYKSLQNLINIASCASGKISVLCNTTIFSPQKRVAIRPAQVLRKQCSTGAAMHKNTEFPLLLKKKKKEVGI